MPRDLQPRFVTHLQQVLGHIYINPLEKCNLKCQICYTRKTAPILSQEAIETFLARYQAVQSIQTVTFCGGEVFALAYFPSLINHCTDQGIFCQVITNGTIDRLDEFTQPNSVNVIVSLDGEERYHDANRGQGTFRQSIGFMQRAERLGFHLNVFSIVTGQNVSRIEQFEASLQQELGFLPEITYHPRKPPAYLMHHPVSNIVGKTDGFDFLTPAQMLTLMKTKQVFPPPQLGCYQIAVASTGKVYGCCEGTLPIGSIDDDPAILIAHLKQRVLQWQEQTEGQQAWKACLGCSQPGFVCGVKDLIAQLSQDAV